jgi:hypothetical protein
MNELLVEVDVPERDITYPVIVSNAKDEMHARLVAYYKIYGKEPFSEDALKELTLIHKKIFYEDAKSQS